MTSYIAADGTILTDEVIGDLAHEAETGLAGCELTAPPAPWKVTEPTVANPDENLPTLRLKNPQP